MGTGIYRYTFQPSVPPAEIEAALVLAIFAAEVLHGEAQVQLDAGHCFDRHRLICVVDAATAVGRDIARLFVGFLQRELDPDSFKVERVLQTVHPISASVN